jgi:hypothetical protein
VDGVTALATIAEVYTTGNVDNYAAETRDGNYIFSLGTIPVLFRFQNFLGRLPGFASV